MRGIFLTILALTHCASTAWCAQSGDFRMDTDLFLDDQTRPYAQNRTLFLEDRVYDFSLLDGEITILDGKSNQFFLLDPKRKIKSVIDTLQVYETTNAIRNRIEQTRGPEAASQQQVKDEDGWLTVEAAPLSYRAKGAAPSTDNPSGQSAPIRYQQFADWYARLNAMRQGNPPPFGRIRLNLELAQRKQLPLEVHRTIGSRIKIQRAHTRHLVVWELSAKDRQWIDTVGEYIATFKTVGADVFFVREREDSAGK